MLLAATPPTTTPMPPRGAHELRVGQLNAYNLFDTVDDPSTQDTVVERDAYRHHLGKLAVTIRDTMGSPDVITLQEVENVKALKDLAARPELEGLGYTALLKEGTDPRGIDTAILYRDTVRLLEVQQLDPIGVSPEGRASHLFSRPPLAARFGIDGVRQSEEGARQLVVVATHFTSKLGGEDAAGKRAQQARVIADYATGVQAASGEDALVIAGDFNMESTEPEFAPLRRTRRAESLVALERQVPRRDRFTWRDGRKHYMLDHMLASASTAAKLKDIQIPHIATKEAKGSERNPNISHGVTDHDPIIATFRL